MRYPWVNMHKIKKKMMYKLTLDATDDNTWRNMCGIQHLVGSTWMKGEVECC